MDYIISNGINYNFELNSYMMGGECLQWYPSPEGTPPDPALADILVAHGFLD